MTGDRTGAVIIILAVLAAACSSVADRPRSCTEPTDEVATHRYAEADGVEAELQSLDVYASPTAQDCPILVWVHGGAWQLGDKRTRATTVKADHFVKDGFVFVSINHRLAASDNSVRWPDFGNDAADAVAWVIDNADTIGGDANRVSIIGHSSGAHLVSIVATNPDLLERSGHVLAELSCVISLDSVTHDLTDPPPWETDIIELAFPEPDLLEDGSPTLQAIANPPGIKAPNILIVTRGREERIASAQRLADAYTTGGGSAEVVDVSPYSHRQVNVELGEPDETVITPVVDRHLEACVSPSGGR